MLPKQTTRALETPIFFVFSVITVDLGNIKKHESYTRLFLFERLRREDVVVGGRRMERCMFTIQTGKRR